MVGALEGLISKLDLKGQTLGEVALGAVIKHSSDWSLARECAIEAGLSLRTAMHRSFTRILIARYLWRSIAHIRHWTGSSQF